MNPTTDRFTIHAVIIGLIALALLVVASLLTALVFADLTTEQRGSILTSLAGFGGVIIGAIAGTLISTRSNPEPVAPVAGAPVNVPVLGGNVEVGPLPEPQDLEKEGN